MDDLLEKVISIARCLAAAGIPHSFGGAIALAYYGYVRGTHDIDINVYLNVEDAAGVLELLHGIGVPRASEAQLRTLRRDGQTRLYWEQVPLDLFFSNLDFHAYCCERRRPHRLLDETIDVLSPEDLVVCKVAFARDKDSRDIIHLLDAIGDRLELDYVVGWVDSIVGLSAPPARGLLRALEERGLWSPPPTPR